MDFSLSTRNLITVDSNQIWVAGVILVIIGSIGNNLGNNLVSLHHKTEQLSEKQRRKDLLNNNEDLVETRRASNTEEVTLITPSSTCSWRRIGTIVFILGNLCTFASFGFAAQSLLASLESIQFVSNVFFVRYVHKEKVTRRMLLATVSIVVGNTLVVIFSDHSAALLTSADIIYLYATNQMYWGYLVCAFVVWLINHFTYTHYFDARVNKNTLLWKHAFIEPFTFAVSSAIIGTQAVLQSKCMSMFIQVSSRGIVNEFMLPHIWWILVSWIILVAYWLRRLDKGLELFPPLFIIPVLQVFFVFFAILCGGIYFEEFDGFTYAQYLGFVIGVLMILGGVYGLAPHDIEVVKINSVMLRQHSQNHRINDGLENPPLRVNDDQKEGEELIIAASIDEVDHTNTTDDPRRVRRLTMEAHDIMYAIADMTLTAGITLSQPIVQVVPAILRQISGSMEDARHAFSHPPSLPHTPQVHPQRPSDTQIPQDPVRSSPRDREEHHKFHNVHDQNLNRPTISTEPVGVISGAVTTDFGPCVDTPGTLAPASYFSSTTNTPHNHHHKVVPLIVDREDV